MRLIYDGVVDREGVSGLARRLGYTERHLHHQLVAELGAGPLALARARRAETARVLIETTHLPVSEVAFASGFSSIRQFNETVRAAFAAAPTELKRTRKGRGGASSGSVALRLPCRPPFDAEGVLAFLGARAVPGMEEAADGAYRRTLRLPRGAGIVKLSAGDGSGNDRAGERYVRCVLSLEDLRDLGAAVERCRRLMDLDADPVAVSEHLGADPLLGPRVRRAPGLRVPGTVDGAELAVRAVLGGRVSVGGACALTERLVSCYGRELHEPHGGLTRLFPEPAALLEADPEGFGVPRASGEALLRLCGALASGRICLGPGADRREAIRGLLSLRGIGPWTASYVAMRALGDPDVFLPTDFGVRRAVEGLGSSGDPKSVASLAEGWRPWRSYAAFHLWSAPNRRPAAAPDARAPKPEGSNRPIATPLEQQPKEAPA
jgi:AraC family transcriptional regulator of adaptative response / DNA-3-methyladenine glycosylase II